MREASMREASMREASPARRLRRGRLRRRRCHPARDGQRQAAAAGRARRGRGAGVRSAGRAADRRLARPAAPEEKDRVMRDFTAGLIDVLVATTVIEVGVDVPNATVMVIMDAERFGVSQLHQLRGRVGRGAAPGLCLLVTEAPPASPSRKRLAAVAATLDGFKLSRLDLEQRREGDILGAAQAGRHSQPEAAPAARRRGPDRPGQAGGQRGGLGRPAAGRASRPARGHRRAVRPPGRLPRQDLTAGSQRPAAPARKQAGGSSHPLQGRGRCDG